MFPLLKTIGPRHIEDAKSRLDQHRDGENSGLDIRKGQVPYII